MKGIWQEGLSLSSKIRKEKKNGVKEIRFLTTKGHVFLNSKCTDYGQYFSAMKKLTNSLIVLLCNLKKAASFPICKIEKCQACSAIRIK